MQFYRGLKFTTEREMQWILLALLRMCELCPSILNVTSLIPYRERNVVIGRGGKRGIQCRACGESKVKLG